MKTLARAFCAASAVGLSLVTACQTTGGPPPTVSVPWRRSASGPEGARWVFAPTKAAPMNGKLALPDGNVLFYGLGGQRWRVSADGVAEAAGELADEDLVDVTRTSNGAWLFVGAQGRVFEAAEPLGPFVRSSVASEPVRRSSASGDRVVSVGLSGSLLRSVDGGRSFARVGDASTRFADALFVRGDEIVALALPEQLLRSTDGGSTFTPLPRPATGASSFVKTPDGIAVVGYYGTSPLEGGLGDGSASHPSELLIVPPVGRLPAAQGLGSVLALSEGRLVAVEHADRSGKGWQIARGVIGARLGFEPLPGADDCLALRIAAQGEILYGVCHVRGTGRSGGSGAVELRRWSPGADKPEIVTGLLGSQAEIKLSIGPSDTLLVSGLCRRGSPCTDAPLFLAGFRDVPPEPEDASEPSPKSATKPPLPTNKAPTSTGGHRQLPTSAFVASSAPQMVGRPLAMGYARSGAAFLLGVRAKTNQLALFVSVDSGRSFAPRGLPPEIASLVRGPTPSGRFRAQISTDEVGVVAISIEAASTAAVVTADEDGRVLAWGAPPSANASTTLGVSGRRLLAVDRTSAHESLDGGASWRTLDSVGTLACADTRCDRPVACVPDGCVVGTDVARVGWGGKTTRPRGFAAPQNDSFPSLAKVPAPLVCRLGKDKWLPFPPGEAGFPLATHADRGKVAWSVLHTSPTGAVSMIHGVPGATPRLDVVPLLRPPPKGSSAAILGVSQIEGGAALRYTYDREKDGSISAKPPRDIEVAWENLFDGKIGRAKLPKSVVPLQPDDVELTEQPAARARVGTLSVSQGAIFVQVQSGRGPLSLVDYAGHVETLEAKETPSIVVGPEQIPFRLEDVRVRGKALQIGFSAVGVVRVEPGVASFALGIPGDTARADAAELVYRGGEPALYHVFRPLGDGGDLATVHAFRDTGPALEAGVPAPTQRDVAFTLRPCTDADRSGTHRIVARRSRPTVRGIVVEAPDGGFFAGGISEEMVVYGTAASPCATVLDGATVSEDDAGVPSDRLLVMLNDLDHGWFFRRSERAPVEARSMKCRVAPKETVPKLVEDALTKERAVSN